MKKRNLKPCACGEETNIRKHFLRVVFILQCTLFCENCNTFVFGYGFTKKGAEKRARRELNKKGKTGNEIKG